MATCSAWRYAYYSSTTSLGHNFDWPCKGLIFTCGENLDAGWLKSVSKHLGSISLGYVSIVTILLISTISMSTFSMLIYYFFNLYFPSVPYSRRPLLHKLFKKVANCKRLLS